MSRAKKFFALPNQGRALSILAVLFVLAAPAVVASLDGDLDEEKMLPTGNIKDEGMVAYYKKSDTWMPTESMTVVKPSANNGIATVAFNTIADAATTSSIIINMYKVSDFVDAKVRKMDLTFSGKQPSTVKLVFKKTGETQYLEIVGKLDAENNSWSISFSSVDSVRVNSGDFDIVSMNLAYSEGANASTDIGIKTYSLLSFNIGEAIMGAMGAVLVICAIFATPLFSIGSKRRS